MSSLKTLGGFKTFALLSLMLFHSGCTLMREGRFLVYEPPATLQDFWDGKAFFEFQHKFGFATPCTDACARPDHPHFLVLNMGTDIVVRNDAWYIFTREFVLYGQRPYFCGSCETSSRHPIQIVVRKSVDKGRTWTNRTVIIDPAYPPDVDPCMLSEAERKPYECGASDGDAYYDPETSTWHYIFQCLDRSRPWALCHVTRESEDPLGMFVDNADNPVVKGGDLWKQICDSPDDDCCKISRNRRKVVDEGTPEIVEKREDGLFYVTFHGFDGVHGYRGVAKTQNFVDWLLVADDAIFDKYDCQQWSLWDSACVGGGLASILKQGRYYYMLIETMDKTLACARNQQWVFGLVRSSTLENLTWETMPDRRSAVIFPTKEPDKHGDSVSCGVQYARLFHDTNGEIYLLVGRIGPGSDMDSITGIYLYKLNKSAPFASYTFREGMYPGGNPRPAHEYTNSDTISRGDLEARIVNCVWEEPPSDCSIQGKWLRFNGKNSVVHMPANPLFDAIDSIGIEVKMKIENLPESQSALIGGKLGSYYLELYNDGNCCFWITTKEVIGSESHQVCAPLQTGKWYTIKGVYDGATLGLYKDSVLVDELSVQRQLWQNQNHFRIGGDASEHNGYWGAFDGLLDYVKIYRAVSEETEP